MLLVYLYCDHPYEYLLFLSVYCMFNKKLLQEGLEWACKSIKKK